jgi:hypothetical protein
MNIPENPKISTIKIMIDSNMVAEPELIDLTAALIDFVRDYLASLEVSDPDQFIIQYWGE